MQANPAKAFDAFKHCYKNACSECMPVITIVIPILILALGIVREPTVWVFITSKYPGIHDIGLPTDE